ncbi:hypothetical protein P5G51_010100 [Virgibacillus sp. 179-BFC.A HS]|uniref:Uncharacterized protein n=1 Tax=Tigheibacillus jepli TaxID=3035914 RepID=A0ABU5CH60_9BACI|nr:hypothetical protein [Virgibacillus sp. 179-BFC.A HS]MDY0405697.1 hypothetical protein [Virgibacillus sp. 179-BFC.A HS]
MHHTKSDIDELKMLIQQAFHHTYIEKYIGKPQIDEEKLYILHYLMQNISLAENKKSDLL